MVNADYRHRYYIMILNSGTAMHLIFSIDFQVNYVSAHDNETLFDIVSLKVL